MERVTHHSLERAADEAVKLWALASAQYPKHDLILTAARESFIETVTVFAVNARRAMEILPATEKYQLNQPRWEWKPKPGNEIIRDLRDALNRVIHAQKLEVMYFDLPQSSSVIEAGAVVVPCIQAETDRKKAALIDPFAMAHEFLYRTFPKLVEAENAVSIQGVH